MTIEGALLSLLKNDAAVATLVSTRVYAARLPQDTTLPAISYHRISTVREHAMGARADTIHARFQVSCWASGYGSSRDVAEAVLGAIDRSGAQTVDSTAIEDIFSEGDVDLFDPEAAESGVHQAALDFLVHYKGT